MSQSYAIHKNSKKKMENARSIFAPKHEEPPPTNETFCQHIQYKSDTRAPLSLRKNFCFRGNSKSAENS